MTGFFGEEFPGSLYLPFNAEGVEAESPALRAAARYAGNERQGCHNPFGVASIFQVSQASALRAQAWAV